MLDHHKSISITTASHTSPCLLSIMTQALEKLPQLEVENSLQLAQKSCFPRGVAITILCTAALVAYCTMTLERVQGSHLVGEEQVGKLRIGEQVGTLRMEEQERAVLIEKQERALKIQEQEGAIRIENESLKVIPAPEPEYRLDVPMWEQKNLEYAKNLPPTDKQICFVHVGKTAGTTLACHLGFLYGDCDAFTEDNVTVPAIPMAAGLLPASTTHLLHTHYDDCAAQDFNYYLFVLRNPLRRIQSWFTYEHPLNRLASESRREKQKLLFTDCEFDTLTELGERGLAPRSEQQGKSNKLDVCQERARMAISGTVGYSTHNYYNFNYYLRQVEDNHSGNIAIAVIRTEHLEADWKSIESGLLNGLKDPKITFARFNASPKRAADLSLSETARERICNFLCNEIQVYKDLLHRAANLHPEDIAVSMADLEASCPVEAALTTCPSTEELP